MQRLSDPRLARLVRDALLFRNGMGYEMLAWVVMPNHLRVVFKLIGEVPSWMGSCKRGSPSLPIASMRWTGVSGPV